MKGIQVHLVDGTYELFRHFFAVPSHVDSEGQEVGALRGVVTSIVGMLEKGATHVGVATDHVVESFRNDLWEGYKTGHGIEPELLSQFHLLENALGSLGVVVWPMVDFEADDAMAAAARVASAAPEVERVFLCTPDKDLAQCVEGKRVVQWDRRKNVILDREGVIAKFGVPPESIPDYLSLVGDTSDGIPGLPGWGPKSASTVLAHFEKIESIPDDAASWPKAPRGAARLAQTLAASRDEASLFKKLATVRTDVPVGKSPEDWRWPGPSKYFAPLCEKIGAPDLARRATAVAARRDP